MALPLASSSVTVTSDWLVPSAVMDAGAASIVDVVAEAGLAFAGEDGVFLRAAEDEAGGDVEDAHRAVCGWNHVSP